ncbi:MAG: dienelactone hydrolase family protein [Phreatobacter sp.]
MPWLLLAAILLLTSGDLRAQERVNFRSQDATEITGILFRPPGQGPFPAVIGLHGCAGLWRRGELDARSADWAARLTAAGFLVLFPDSYSPRGLTATCTTRDRAVRPRGRALDAAGAAEWLARQPFVDQRRIALIGWSNGGTTALYATGTTPPSGVDYRLALIFYPGCRGFLRSGWSPRQPVTILHGEADDWTPAEPCAAIARSAGAAFIGYPGAFHDFDHPDLPLRSRRAAYAQRPDGQVTIGTNPAARQDAIGRVMAALRGM